MLLLMYLIIGAVVCGANYFVMQDKEGQWDFDELGCTFWFNLYRRLLAVLHRCCCSQRIPVHSKTQVIEVCGNP